MDHSNRGHGRENSMLVSSDGSFGNLATRTATTYEGAMAQEAALISQATQQAMIAARSILLSGGSQSTAMSTAKAAAQSILVPHSSDMEGPAAGRTFLGRRKAKRQANVIASMALVSVNNSIRTSHYAPGHQHDPLAEPWHQPAVTVPMMMHHGVGGNNSSTNDPAMLAAGYYRDLHPYMRSSSEHHDQRSPRSPSHFSTTPRSERLDMSPRDSSVARMHTIKESWKRRKARADRFHDDTDSLVNVNAKILETMPRTRSRAKDFADQVPQEDPIYDARGTTTTSSTTGDGRQNSISYSVSDDSLVSSGSDTFGFDERTAMVQTNTCTGGNPNVTVWSGFKNVFMCGGPPTSTLGSASTQSVMTCMTIENNNNNNNNNIHTQETNEEQNSTASVVEEEQRDDVVEKPRRLDATGSTLRHTHAPPESNSSVDSDELLRRLNLSSSEEDNVPMPAKEEEPKRAFRDSVENIVLKALSTSAAAGGAAAETKDEKPQKIDRVSRARLERSVDRMSGLQPNPDLKSTSERKMTERRPIATVPVIVQGSKPPRATAPVTNTTTTSPTSAVLANINRRSRFRQWVRQKRIKSKMENE